MSQPQVTVGIELQSVRTPGLLTDKAGTKIFFEHVKSGEGTHFWVCNHELQRMVRKETWADMLESVGINPAELEEPSFS